MKRTTSDRNRPMFTHADAIDDARKIAAGMVVREERRCGSRMTAYEEVAKKIGASSSWLRKLIGRQHVGIKPAVYANLQRSKNETPADLARRLRARLDEIDATRAVLASELARLDVRASD